jgi:hypothetical protein
MSSVTLVHTYFEVMLDYGWRRKFDQKEVCEELGVSKSTFYRTLSLCKLEGYLDFEAVGGVSVKNVNPYHRKACVKSETEVSRNSDLGEEEEPETEMAGTVVSNLKPVGSNLKPVGQISDSSFKSETATPSKPLPETDSGNPSYSSQISFKSPSSSSQMPPAVSDDEGGDEKIFFEEGKEEAKTGVIDALVKEGEKKDQPEMIDDKHKVRIRVLEWTLKKCDEDPNAWASFFDWCEEELWPSFKTPIRDKTRWLMSIDPETGTTRLELNWINYQDSIQERNENAPKKRSANKEWEKLLRWL